MHIQIGHVSQGAGEYIGRAGRGRAASSLANPFRIGKDGTREEVITRYKSWLWKQIQAGNRHVMAELVRLRGLAQRPEGVTLACFCRSVGEAEPQCHGDVIAKALAWLDGHLQDPLVAEAILLGGVPLP